MGLARAWMEQSATVVEQNGETFWEGVTDRCEKADMQRTSSMLKSKWSFLQKHGQLYNQAKTAVESLNQSGVTEDDKEDQIQRVCRERASRNERGKVVLATPFKYIDVANYLSLQPKFNQALAGPSRVSPGYQVETRSIDDEASMGTINDEPSSQLDTMSGSNRPQGAKRQKLMVRLEKQDHKLREEVKAVRKVM